MSGGKNLARASSKTLLHVLQSWAHVQHRSTSLFMWRKIAMISEKCAATIFFDLTQNWNNKIFIIWYVRTIIRGSGELCEHIMLRPNGLHTPNPSGSNIFFHNFVYVCQTSNHLRIWSLCLLVVFSASLENLLVNKLVVPRWSSVFRT